MKSSILRWAIALILLVGAFVATPLLESSAREATVARAVDRAVQELEERLPDERPDLRRPVGVRLFAEDEEAAAGLEALRARIGQSPGLELAARGKTLRLLLAPEGGEVRIGLAFDEGSVQPVEVDRREARVSTLSVVPPILAILLAVATGKLLLSLGLATAFGAFVAADLHPIAAISKMTVDYGVRETFTDPSKLWIFVFTTCLIGTVALITRAGGMQGVVRRLSRIAKGPRSTKMVTLLMGVAIFFDDYANSILVGGAMRPLTDKMRISREKLSYLVDSTSAPVAGLALISTWIGYEVGLLGEASESLGLGMEGYEIFLRSLPFRFYCMFTLAFAFILVWSERDFGPMLRAERRAATTGEVLRPGARPLSGTNLAGMEGLEGVGTSPLVALLPVGLILFGTLFGLFWDGGGLAAVSQDGWALLRFSTIRQAFGAADSTRVLGIATLLGSATAFALVLGKRLLSAREAAVAFWRGARSMGVALAILTLAWGLKAALDDLGTSELLVAGLQETLDPRALPMLVFVLASAVALTTGTSWGTMGILIPTAAPLAYHLGGIEGMFLTTAAVLDGAIFGDHVSPISDTTVMSSIASGADHMDHVKTQLPYAAAAMGAALLFGYGWNSMEWGYGAGWLLGLLALAGVIFGLGRKPRAATAPTLGLSADP